MGLMRCVHLDDLAQLLSNPLLRGVIRSSPGAGPFGVLALQELVGRHAGSAPQASTSTSPAAAPAQHGHPRSHSGHHATHSLRHLSMHRALSTSAAPHKNFQTVLRKPVPKSHLFNTDNLTEWQSSGFDARVALTLLESAYAGKMRKQQEREGRAVQRELSDMMRRCSSAEQVEAIVNETHAHMSRDNMVLAISKVTKLPQVTPPRGPSSGPPLVPGLLDALLPALQPHLPALRTGQLAVVLAALARTRHQPGHDITRALLEQLDGDSGLERADAAGPRETAALMLAAARLGWGSPQLWNRLGEATLAQLKDMAPQDVAQALQAAAISPGVASSELCGASSLLWVHAEQVVMSRRSQFDAALLAKLLLSFSVVDTPAGAQLRQEMVQRLQGGVGTGARGLTPAAVVTLLRSAAAQLQRRRGSKGGGGDRTTAESLMQHGLRAAAQVVPHLGTRSLEQVLAAVDATYGPPAEGAAPLRVVSELLVMVGDVLALRGLHSEEPGAVPAPVPARAAVPGASAARVMSQLVRLGYLSGPEARGARPQRLLAAVLRDAEQLQARGKLSAPTAACLTQGFVAAAAQLETAAAVAAARSMAGILAQALQPAGAEQLLPAATAAPLLVALADGGGGGAAGDGVAAALRCLADQLAASKELSRLGAEQTAELRRVADGAPALRGHALSAALR